MWLPFCMRYESKSHRDSKEILRNMHVCVCDLQAGEMLVVPLLEHLRKAQRHIVFGIQTHEMPFYATDSSIDAQAAIMNTQKGIEAVKRRKDR